MEVILKTKAYYGSERIRKISKFHFRNQASTKTTRQEPNKLTSESKMGPNGGNLNSLSHNYRQSKKLR